MMAMVSMMVFAGALATAAAVVAITVLRQGRRILRVAAGHADRAFAPLETLALAERRIAVRRRASLPVPARRLREVA